MKKILAIMLAVFMLVSVFSVNVFAVDETEEDTADVQGTASTSFLGACNNDFPWSRVVNPDAGWEPPSEGWLDTSVIKFQNWHFNITDLVLKAAGVKDIANIVSVKATVELVGKDSIGAYRTEGNPTVQLEYGKVYNPNGTAFGADAAYIEDDIIDIAVCNNFEGNKATVSGKIPAGAKVITLDLGGFGKITKEDKQEFVISVEVEFIPEEPEEKEIVVYSKDEPLPLGKPWDTVGVGNRWGGDVKDFDISLSEIKNIIAEGGATFIAVVAYDGTGFGDSNLMLSFDKYTDGVKDDANGTEIKITATSRVQDADGNYVVTFNLDKFLPILEKAGVKLADMPFFMFQSGSGDVDWDNGGVMIHEGKLVSAKFVITKTGDEEPETVVAKRNSGVIYIDEEYHGMLVNGHLLTYPHEADNALGYCPVCNAIIEANEEVEVEVVDPTEPGDVETETDEPTIDVTEPEQPTEEEKNPPMGIAFAVLPMAVAAAALVSSKRR